MCRSAARLLIGPTSEPVTLAEAKRQANVVATDDDALLTSLIIAAREFVEESCSRALIEQTWLAQYSEWPRSGVCLPRPPLLAITHVKYYGVSELLETLPSTDYRADTVSQPGRLWWDDDDILPVLDSCEWPVLVTYTAGYSAAAGTSSSSSSSSGSGDAAAAVPARAKQAILLLVAHWYRNREAVLTGTISKEIELAFLSLTKSLRVGVYP